MKLTEMVLRNRVVSITIIVLAFIGGIISYLIMPKAEDPGFTIRQALVVTYFPGISSEKVEKLITDKVEEAVNKIPEIKKITSTSKNGFSMVTVEVSSEYKNMKPIWDNLRRKLENLDLPNNTFGPFVDDEFGDVYGTIIGITGKNYSYKELKTIADKTRTEFLTIPEVAKVNIIGAQEERIFIEYKNDKLAEMGITPYQLQEILSATNIVIPGGSIQYGDETLSLEPTGNFNTIEDLKMLVVTAPNSNQSFYLKDIAEVKAGYIDPISSELRISNEPGLALAISMKDGNNIVNLGNHVKEKLNDLNKIYPAGIETSILNFQPKVVDDKIKSFSASLVQSIITVIIIMLIFLGLRTGVLVSSMIPIIVMVAFLVMFATGVAVEQVSLAALIIALGMLVDNSIVVAESIMVKMEHGITPEQAAIESSSELKFPLLISSLTTCSAFLPIALAKSDVGEFCLSLFQVITITLLLSWILSLTVIPLLCVLFLKVEKKEQHYSSMIYRLYRGFLIKLLKVKYLAISVLIITLFVSTILLQKIPFVFIPNADKPVLTATIKFPGGTSIKKTEQAIKEIDAFISKELKVEDNPEKSGILNLFLSGGSVKHYKHEGVLSWGSFIGESAPRFYLSFVPELSAPEYGFILINTTSNEIIPEITKKIEKFCLNKYPEMDFYTTLLEIGPPVGKPIQIRIIGNDMDKLYKISDQVKQKIRTIEGTKNINDDWGIKSKKVMINIDQAKARKAGLTSGDIAGSLYTMIDGYSTSNFRQNTNNIPIVLRSKEARSNSFDDIENAKIYSSTLGLSTNLSQIANINFAWEPSVIYRTNKSRTITVNSDIKNNYNAINIINNQLIPWLDEQQKTWGYGYKYEIGGALETSNDNVNGIIKALPIAGMLILLLLIIQFNSYKKVGVLISIMPFIIIPVALILAITGKSFGFMPALGLIALAGISINTGIVLMDKINSEMNDGKELHEAIIDSCQSRLRPIVLTTSTTIFGLIPLWLSGGPLFSTMAIVMMVGLMFIILLVLIILPVIFSIFYKVNFKNYLYEEPKEDDKGM